MSRYEWKRKMPWEKTYEGPRAADYEETGFFDIDSRIKIDQILDVMQWPKVIVFMYGESDRIVAPFVLGVSSEGNPLMRGYQLEGTSKSGKGPGWRVYQIIKMDDIEDHNEFFEPEEFDFKREYPWTYKVFAML